VNFALETPGTGAAQTELPVSVLSPGGRKVTYFLENGEWLPNRLTLTDAPPGSAMVTVQLQKVQLAENKVWLPNQLIVAGQNRPVTIMQVEHIKFNTGMINAIFDRPPMEEAASAGAPQNAQLPRAATPAGAAGFHDSLKGSFEANAMRVHDFVAQTNAFNTTPPARIEPGVDAANAPPVLADYGFPWPLPW
jgi:hypothetical protein